MNKMATLAARRERPYVAPDHQGPLINIIAWIAAVSMALFVLLVLGSKLATRRKLTTEDLLLTVAMVFSAGQTIALSMQTENGLGSYLSTLTSSQIDVFQRAGYASSLLYIATLVFAKASTLTVLKRLTPNRTHRSLIWGVLIAVSIWGFTSFLGSAFQCAPTTKINDPEVCFNQVQFWDFVGAFDILTDILIMVCPAVVVWNLQLPFDKKAAVVTAFAFRILAVIATIVRLVYVPRAFNSANYTHSSTAMAIATQISLFGAIFSSAAPHLRPFMESMQAGYFSGAIRGDKSDNYGYGTHNSLPVPTQHSLGVLSTSSPRSPGIHGGFGDMRRTSKQRSNDMIRSHSESRKFRAAMGGAPSGDEISFEGRSSEHSTELMVIKQTREWSVTVEERTDAEKIVNKRPFD